MQVNISPHTISRFLYSLEYHPLIKTGEIKYRLEEMYKITRKQMEIEDKMRHLRWIAGFIAPYGKNNTWVVGGPGVVSQKTKKHTLTFDAKAWWTLAQHQLCSTTRDNFLSLVSVDLIVGFITSYEFDIGELLSREIRDQAVGG